MYKTSLLCLFLTLIVACSPQKNNGLQIMGQPKHSVNVVNSFIKLQVTHEIHDVHFLNDSNEDGISFRQKSHYTFSNKRMGSKEVKLNTIFHRLTTYKGTESSCSPIHMKGVKREFISIPPGESYKFSTDTYGIAQSPEFLNAIKNRDFSQFKQYESFIVIPNQQEPLENQIMGTVFTEFATWKLNYSEIKKTFTSK